MKKFKLPIIIFLILTVITIALVFIPESAIIRQIPFGEELYNNCKINVTSVNGKAEIKIDGKEFGQTNQEIEDLSPGLHKVELSRVTESKSFYNKRFYPVELAPGTESVIKVEIGPEDLTGGYILYYTEATTEQGKGLLTVTVDNYEGLIYLDDEYFGTSPIKAEEIDSSTYSIRIEGEGYEEVEIPTVKIEEGYNLNIIVYLMPIPIQEL